jgi:hypothetical protein
MPLVAGPMGTEGNAASYSRGVAVVVARAGGRVAGGAGWRHEAAPSWGAGPFTPVRACMPERRRRLPGGRERHGLMPLAETRAGLGHLVG